MQTGLLKTIIVDDEQPSRDALDECIREFCPTLKVVAKCHSAESACQAIQKHKPGLVFLDIEMPRGNGFDLLKICNPLDFKVIFVTAFSDYAVQAFRFSAIDYLLKPVKVEELVEAVKKAEHEVADYQRLIRTLLENLQSTGNHPGKLVISDVKGLHIINIDDIILCEANGYCTTFYLRGKTRVSSSRILKHYEEILPPEQFFRAHHSYMINLDHVKGLTTLGELLLAEEVKCPLSIHRKADFMKLFKTHR